MNARLMVAAAIAMALASGTATGAGLIVYPANGQSAQQQQQDQAQCYEWATNQVGFDPAYGVPAAAPPPAQSNQVGMGLLGGGLLGGLIGGVTHGNMAQSVGIGIYRAGTRSREAGQGGRSRHAQGSGHVERVRREHSYSQLACHVVIRCSACVNIKSSCS